MTSISVYATSIHLASLDSTRSHCIRDGETVPRDVHGRLFCVAAPMKTDKAVRGTAYADRLSLADWPSSRRLGLVLMNTRMQTSEVHYHLTNQLLSD